MTQRQRRKLTAVDDPLESPAPRPAAVARPSVAPRRAARPDDDDVQALFVRIRAAHGEALARAAFELRLHKQEIVAALIARYVDPHSADGLEATRTLVEGYRDGWG